MQLKKSKKNPTTSVDFFCFSLVATKILNKKNSLNAAFSYKYSGFDKASVANTAVDERFAMFYSTVIVASAREAVSMVDMYSGGS
ncbi:MAG: Tn3 family transposase [Bacteroidota bacterium]